MEASQNWSELLQNIGIIGGLFFSACSFLLAIYAMRRDTRSRKVANSFSVMAQYREIWKEPYTQPELSRVLKQDVDLNKEPVSLAEEIWMTTLVQHLGMVYRAMKYDEYPALTGLRKDVAGFFILPIASAIWDKAKAFQDADLVGFIDDCLNSR